MPHETLKFSGTTTQFKDFTESETGKYYTSADSYPDRNSQETWAVAQITEAVDAGRVTASHVLSTLDALAEGVKNA